MPRSANKLSAATVKRTNKTGVYADGNGLYLQVKNDGKNVRKSWLFRYMRAGKSRSMGLGSIKTTSLAAARIAAADAKKLLHAKQDPLAHKRTNTASSDIPYFSEASATYIDTHKSAWKNKKHIAQWTNTLRDYANPIIGPVPIDEIDRSHVLDILKPIWLTKPETATRVRGRIERILDWARVEGLREGDNPARFRGNLEYSLPRQEKARRVVHHPALPLKDLPEFFASLVKQDGVAAQALQFTILTAARTNEVRFASYDEFDLKDGASIWTIPAGRMKTGKEHRVPLTPYAVALVNSRPSETPYLFSPYENKPMSENGMLALLKRMQVTDITVHGFRSTFRDWAAEQTDYPREVVETSLAHTNRDHVEAAYLRTDLFEKRRALLELWDRYVRSSA